MRSARGVAILIAITCTALACGEASVQTEPPPPVETPSPNEADAIRIRTTFGLRSDIDYIRQVAADPRASSVEYSVPLLPFEIADLNARVRNTDAVRGVIVAYTERHPDEFAGVYIDQEHGGAFTTMWTAHLEEHEAAIRALIHPDANVAFRGATYAYQELRSLKDRISADWEWMRQFDIAPQGVGVDIIKNLVEVDVSSANPNAVALITAHYDVQPGMLEVISDGTGAALIPYGNVRGRVVDVLGRPPGEPLAWDLALSWTSDDPGSCGGGDIGYGVAANGAFEVPCQEGRRTIEVEVRVSDGKWRTIGSGDVLVVANAVVTLEIRLPGSWPEPTAP